MKYRNALIIASVIAIDQISKLLIRFYLKEPIKILPFFQLRYSENTGAAFSLFSDQNTLLIFLVMFIIGLLVYNFYNFKKKERCFVSMIIGGALANLFDRIYLGFVVDFLDFRIWPVFNLADSAVTLGALGLIFLMFKKN